MFRTDAQRNACDSCPVAKVADLIGDSTVLLIIRDLTHGPRRFNELQTSFPGVSTRTLTQKLKALESEGLIEKKKYSEFPPRIDYLLTKKGRGLLPIIKALEKYGKQYLT